MTASTACAAALPLVDYPTPKLHTPRWAFEPWISKDISSTDDTYAFADGFADRGIPVGVVVLDSPWETSYSTLQPNPARYHDFAKLVADLRARNIRTVLWTTAMINSTSYDFEEGGDRYEGPSPNFEEALSCGFFVNAGQEFQWWKGKGGALDFFNPRARAWWHEQQNTVLNAGVSGFKLDFGESYVRASTLETAAGTVSRQAYSEEYYRDFLAYGVAKKGPEEFLTMVRAWDKSYDFEGRFFARKEHAPVVWAGDNRRDFIGLADALEETFISARAGYVVLGADVGGYLDLDDVTRAPVPASTETFMRWTAIGALSPFMQLHGRANLTPWTVPDHVNESVAAWKYWGTLHHALVPFFYSLAEEAYAGAGNIVRPEGEPPSWAGDYRYHLGEALFVAPILSTPGIRDIALPAGASYVDWWRQGTAPLPGGTTLKAHDVGDLARVPLFIREGAIIPLVVDDPVLGLGSAKGALTVLVYPGGAESRFVVHDEDGKTTTITAARETKASRVTVSRAPAAVRLRVRAESGASSVEVDGAAVPGPLSEIELDAAPTGFRVDPASRSVWVKAAASPAARAITVRD